MSAMLPSLLFVAQMRPAVSDSSPVGIVLSILLAIILPALAGVV